MSNKIVNLETGTFSIDYDSLGRVRRVVRIGYRGYNVPVIFIDNVVYNKNNQIVSIELPNLPCQFKLRADGNWDRIYPDYPKTYIGKSLHLSSDGELRWYDPDTREIVLWGTGHLPPLLHRELAHRYQIPQHRQTERVTFSGVGSTISRWLRIGFGRGGR